MNSESDERKKRELTNYRREKSNYEERRKEMRNMAKRIIKETANKLINRSENS